MSIMIFKLHICHVVFLRYLILNMKFNFISYKHRKSLKIVKMGILCENSSIREYIKITLNKIENNLDLEIQDRLVWNRPIYIYIYIYIYTYVYIYRTIPHKTILDL